VTAVIDWQRLAYCQKWEVATTQRGLWSYGVYNQEDGNDWQLMLSNALYDEGFPLELDFMGQIVLEDSSVMSTCRGREKATSRRACRRRQRIITTRRASRRVCERNMRMQGG
jgi:hypothetical protein